MQIFQHTLAKKVRFTGKGVHTGRVVVMDVIPQDSNFGIKFERTDLDRKVVISAEAQNISETKLSTRIGEGQKSIGTIEHLMAAFFGLGISNVLVKVNAPELPILDGSSKEYVEAFLNAGVVQQNAYRRFYVVKKPFAFHDGEKFVRIEPDSKLSYNCRIDFNHKSIGEQTYKMEFTTQNFLDISDARTFCFKKDIEAMRERGLALGGSLANAVVVDEAGVVNEEGLRSDNEFVRHKLLDCIGDLALLGAPLMGKVTVNLPGHGLHADFMNALLKEKFEYLTVIEPADFGDFRKARTTKSKSTVAAASVR